MISVIVPVYNVEKYLDKCIESILNQSYTDWELILIDDGSIDKSGDICDRYSNMYAKIKTYHKLNGGQSSARNIGIDKSEGDFICFVDSDDWLDVDFLKRCFNDYKEYKADIITCNYFISKSGKNHLMFKNSVNCLCDNTEAMKKLMKNEGTSSSVCARLYKKELFNNLRFKEGVLFEDAAISYKIFHLAKNIYFEKMPLYYYFYRNNSTMSRKDKKIRIDEIQVSLIRYKEIKKSYDIDISELAFSNFVFDLIHVEQCFIRDGYNYSELEVYLKYLKQEQNRKKYKYLKYLPIRKKIEAILMLKCFPLFYFLTYLLRWFSKR